MDNNSYEYFRMFKVIFLPISLQGNYWYKLHAEGKIKRIRESIIPHQVRDELARQGGTNLVGALTFFFLMLLLTIIAVLMALKMGGKI